MIRADLCVIGAGSGGLSVAAGAVQMGASVVLVEAGRMGGDCLNWGCVPSKALLSAAERGLGWAEAHAHVTATIAAIAPHDSVERFEGLGVTVVEGFARFVSPYEVAVGDTRIRARRFVLATGSAPLIPAIPGLDGVPYLTNETIFDLAAPPEHLLILGAGPVGLELALAHRRLGVAVTVVEAGRALGREDPEAATLVVERLRAEGVEVLEQTPVAGVSAAGNGVEVEAGGRRLAGSHLLLAAGRKPRVDGLGLELAGIGTGPRGVTVNPGLRTSNRRVYAIGDVTGAGFTHAAGYQAGVIVRSILFGLPAKAGAAIPRVTYAEPELAQIGLTEAEARAAHGESLEVIHTDFAANDRALTGGETAGFLKLVVHRGRPVGVTIVGADAGEQIALWALVFAGKVKLSTLASTVLPYPTRAEISKRAAGTYFSPRLFGNPTVKRVVRAVQRLLP